MADKLCSTTRSSDALTRWIKTKPAQSNVRNPQTSIWSLTYK